MDPSEIEKNAPCAAPIDNLEELVDWQGGDDYYVGVAPLEPRRRLEHLPRTLVCHDMAGGYLEDRFVQGSGKYDAYRFYHWHLVDTFVYFSHHMVTIPPPCWINAAHKHGVPVLGTFITEWDDGYHKCKQLLSDQSLMERVVSQMVDLAIHHSMDGWLINIENKIDYALIPNLTYFLRLLTDRMHEANSSSQVIWYDSVTTNGELDWQNELNALNSPFFDECDAIFLNYTWNADNLYNTAVNCKGRLHDVYVGIDVFGRGMIGGGGYNTKEAVAIARKSDLSIALFAPGWVYEVNGTRDFNANEERFWYYLQPYLPMHTSCSLPLSSTFCQGWGQQIFIDGQAVSEEPWSNLSMQQLQPTLNHSELGDNPHQQYKWLHLQDGFMGGGAMRFVGHLPASDIPDALVYRVFDTNIPADGSMYVAYKMKRLPMEDGVKLCLYLILNKDEPNEERLLLPEDDIITSVHTFGDNDTYIQSLTHAETPKALRTSLSVERETKWVSRVFLLDGELCDNKTLDEIGMLAYTENVEPTKLNVLLGQVQIMSSMDETLEPVNVTNLHTDEVYIESNSHLDKKYVTMKLNWAEPDIAADVTSYNIWYSVNGGDKHWLGSTYTNKFYISDLELEGDHGDVVFTVQVLYKAGIIEDVTHASKLSFPY